jgi:uncharacterized iron-regulated membrane protein
MSDRKKHRRKWGRLARIRELLFRLHSWLGIFAGVYVVLMGFSGSVLVFYPELYRALSPQPAVSSNRPPLAMDQLKRVIKNGRFGREIAWMWERKAAGVYEVRLSNANNQSETRLINAFTGEDLGPAYPRTVQALNLTKDFHTELPAGPNGRLANLFGGLLFVALAATGAATWWPGRQRWRRHMLIRRRSRGRRLIWEVHSAIGFWSLILELMWGITGIIMLLDASSSLRFVNDPFIRICYKLHFGTFGERLFSFVWSLAGLAVPTLALTGIVMWWNRSVKEQKQRHFSIPATRYFAGPPSSSGSAT